MVIQKNGVRLTVRGDHGDYWRRVADGTWEPRTFAVFDRYIDGDTTVFDIGAWIGATALYAAHRARFVYAFEPDPVAFAELSDNLEANPTIRNVRIVNACIGAENGRLRLGATGAPGSAMSSLLSPESEVVWEVKAVRLDEFIRRLAARDPIFVKMDIQGYEYTLMPTVAALLGTRNATLHLSTHPGIASRKRADENVLNKIMKRLRMLRMNARLAWALRSFHVVLDSRGRRINTWTRIPRALFGQSLTRDSCLVAISTAPSPAVEAA